MFKKLLFFSLLTVFSSAIAAKNETPKVVILPAGTDFESYDENHAAAVAQEGIDHSIDNAPLELKQYILQNSSAADYKYWFTTKDTSRADAYIVRLKATEYYLYKYKIDECRAQIAINETLGGFTLSASSENRFSNDHKLFQESVSNPNQGATFGNLSCRKNKNEEALEAEANQHSMNNAPEELGHYLTNNPALSDYAYWFLNKAECATDAHTVQLGNGTKYFLCKYRVNKYVPNVSTEQDGKLNILLENSNYFTNDSDLFTKIQAVLNEQNAGYQNYQPRIPVNEQALKTKEYWKERDEYWKKRDAEFKKRDEEREALSKEELFEKIKPIEKIAELEAQCAPSAIEKKDFKIEDVKNIFNAPSELNKKIELLAQTNPEIPYYRYYWFDGSEYCLFKYKIMYERGEIITTAFTNDFNLVKDMFKKEILVDEYSFFAFWSTIVNALFGGWTFQICKDISSLKYPAYTITAFWPMLWITSNKAKYHKVSLLKDACETLTEEQYLKLRSKNYRSYYDLSKELLNADANDYLALRKQLSSVAEWNRYDFLKTFGSSLLASTVAYFASKHLLRA